MGNNYIKLAKSLICEGRSRKITKNKFLDLYNSKAAAYSF